MDEQQKQEIIDMIRDTVLEVFGQTQVKTQKPSIDEIIEDEESEISVVETKPKNQPQPKDKDLGVYSIRGNTPSSSVSQPSKKPSKKKSSKNVKSQDVRSDKGTPARAMPFDKNAERPDLFVRLGFDEMCKEDVEIDKKLNEGRTPTKRGTRTTLVDVECNRCGRPYTVSNQLVRKVGDELVYVCDKCVGRG